MLSCTVYTVLDRSSGIIAVDSHRRCGLCLSVIALGARAQHHTCSAAERAHKINPGKPAIPGVQTCRNKGTPPVDRVWHREDKGASAFRTTMSNGPEWSTVPRLVTTDLHTSQIIEYLKVDATQHLNLYYILPSGPRGTRTTLHYRGRQGVPSQQSKGRHQRVFSESAFQRGERPRTLHET